MRTNENPAALLALACLSGVFLVPALTGAQAPGGMVDDPCPPALEPSYALQNLLAEIFFEPRELTAADFERLEHDPDLVALNAANRERAARDWAGICRYDVANRRTAASAAAPRIVFMGDSITENWAAADPDFFAGGIVGRGIGGQTTPQMLLRFRADVVALRPRAVHIMAGTNDIAGNTGPTSPQAYKNNMMSMVEIAKANGIDVILGSIPPAAAFGWRPDMRPAARIAELNAWLRDYAAAMDIQFIDYHAALAGPSGELRPELGNDGVHPNRNGYAIMRRLVERSLPSGDVARPR